MKKNEGFTLVEMIVTMAIMSIVLVIAAWSFKDFIWRNQVNSAANDLVSAMNLARSEAITRGRPVTLCRSANGTSCSDSGLYSQGWVVFFDPNGNGTVEVLRAYSAAPRGVFIEREDGNPATNIVYSSTGFLQNPIASGTFIVHSLAKSIDVTLESSGRVTTKASPPL